jgi:putative ABC transport system permease protein
VAIGASRAEVIGLVLDESFRPVIAGLAIGLAAALLLGRFVAALLFQVQPADPWVLAAVAIATASAALTACWLPLRRALRVDPLEALRCD